MVQAFCGYTGLLNFLTCFSLAIFLYSKNRYGKINKLFALWSVSVAFWSLGYFIWLFTTEYAQALFWTRVLMAGAIIIPSAYMHFALVYLDEEKKHNFLIRFCWLFSFAYLLLDATPFFVARVEARAWFRWWPVPGVLYHPFQLYFVLAVIYAHYLLFKRALMAPSGIMRKQYLIVAWGTLIAYTGGSMNFFLWYNIPVPPVFNFLVTGYVAFIAYAILHYRLWNIDVFLKRQLYLPEYFLRLFFFFSR